MRKREGRVLVPSVAISTEIGELAPRSLRRWWIVALIVPAAIDS
jgi:hypothetical protein